MSPPDTVRMEDVIVADTNLVLTAPALSLQTALVKVSRTGNESSSTDLRFYDDLASLREHNLAEYNLVVEGFLRQSKMAFVCEDEVCSSLNSTNPGYTIRCAPACLHRPHWVSGEEELEAFVEAKDLFILQQQGELPAPERPSDSCIPCPNLLQGTTEADLYGTQPLQREPAPADNLILATVSEAPPYCSTIFEQWLDTLSAESKKQPGTSGSLAADHIVEYRSIKEQEKADPATTEPQTTSVLTATCWLGDHSC